MRFQGVVSRKGHLVIPAELRRVCGIKEGTRVQFKRIPGGIGIYIDRTNGIDDCCGVLARYDVPPGVERDPDRELR